MLLLLPVIVVFIAYGTLMLYYWQAWKQLPAYHAPDTVPDTTVTILIPVRNEAAYIGRLLHCLQAQHYPRHLVQIVVIDDGSTDDTRAIVEQFPGIELVVLDDTTRQSHKKRAIETGMLLARGEWIVTTDGDCHMGPDWLRQLMLFQQEKQAKYVAAPVVTDTGPALVQRFQCMDFAVLQGVTGVAVQHRMHAMSNGANQAYPRTVFEEVGGYSGVDHIASGDDLFLLQKINARYPGQAAYLPGRAAIVHTAPVSTWREFLQQRIRWASKARYYSEWKIKAVALLVYLVNLCFPVLLAASVFRWQFLLFTVAAWIVKALIEWPFVSAVFRFFSLRISFVSYFVLQPLHILYILVSGFLGLAGKYEWKGRNNVTMW